MYFIFLIFFLVLLFLCKKSKRHSYITLVVGPPASGKSTYIQNNRLPQDVVVEWDAISQAVGHNFTHGARGWHYKTATIARKAIIDSIIKDEIQGQIWISSTDVNAQAYIPYDRLVTLNPPLDLLLDRIQSSRDYSTVDCVMTWKLSD
jgi:hypothetical protein